MGLAYSCNECGNLYNGRPYNKVFAENLENTSTPYMVVVKSSSEGLPDPDICPSCYEKVVRKAADSVKKFLDKQS